MCSLDCETLPPLLGNGQPERTPGISDNRPKTSFHPGIRFVLLVRLNDLKDIRRRLHLWDWTKELWKSNLYKGISEKLCRSNPL